MPKVAESLLKLPAARTAYFGRGFHSPPAAARNAAEPQRKEGAEDKESRRAGDQEQPEETGQRAFEEAGRGPPGDGSRMEGRLGR